MAYDGNGVFLPLPSPTFPAVAGSVIYAEYFNLNLKNIHDGLSAALPRDGQVAMSGNLSMGGFKLTGSAAATTAGDVVEFQQWLDSFYAPSFTTPTTQTPPLGSDNSVIPNTAWVRAVMALAATINLPSIAGKNGQLSTDGTGVFWRSATPDFYLNASGIS